MEASTELAARLSKASVKKAWDVYSAIDWPAELDRSRWAMSPELVSLHGTPTWDRMSEEERKRLSFHDLIAFFSLTLHGERPLIQGLAGRLYMGLAEEITDYLHHFLDEENKHMVMFGEFCKRYAGRVYPEKKLAFPTKYTKGEEELMFFLKALVVEELGDVYNVEIARDERVEPLVREINDVHHMDEARHLVFGRRYLRDVWEKHSPSFTPEVTDRLRSWFASYLQSSWRDFYNPTAYRDSGIEDPMAAREEAWSSPVCRAHRERVSRVLVDLLLDIGILTAAPSLQ